MPSNNKPLTDALMLPAKINVAGSVFIAAGSSSGGARITCTPAASVAGKLYEPRNALSEIRGVANTTR